MANLKDLIVSGSSRFISDVFADNIKANKFITNGGTASQYVKGDGELGGAYAWDSTNGGTTGLVPAAAVGDSGKFLGTSGWQTIPTQNGDHKVTQVATATDTTKYPLLFKYTGGSSYTADETNYARFSKVASSSASILSATPAGDLYSKSLTATGGNISTTQSLSAGTTITAGTNITATNGDIICMGSGKYFKGLLAPHATATSAYIYTYANQPLSGSSVSQLTTSEQEELLGDDTKPASVKNMVLYVRDSINDISDIYLPLAGGIMYGNIDMGSGSIINLEDGSASTDAATVGQSLVKTTYSGSTYFDAEGLNIRRVATPTQDTDATNKAYVDSRVSNPTFAAQDVAHNQLDGTKDFNIATVLVPSQQTAGTNYYLNFTDKISSVNICHLLLHTSTNGGEGTPPYPVNYGIYSVEVKIPANIRVWDSSNAASGDMEGVWINGEQVMWCDVSLNSNFSDRGKRFTIPANGFVEVSVLFVQEECQIKKGETVTTFMVYRTMIKVDAPLSSYQPIN
jgi:hypothetical protein